MIKTIALLATILVLSFTRDINTQQEKEYTVKATIQEWQVILANQDDVAKSVRDKVIQKFAIQINQQIADTVSKKK